MKVGRPTDYTPALAEEICDAIATHPLSLNKLCEKNPHWPVPRSIYRWLSKYPIFSQMYASAKICQVSPLVEEIIDIADDCSKDTIYSEKGESCDTEWVNRSRLRVDTRKWFAAKLVPRLYGDNVLAQELAREMEEFKKMLAEKNKDK